MAPLLPLRPHLLLEPIVPDPGAVEAGEEVVDQALEQRHVLQSRTNTRTARGGVVNDRYHEQES